MQEGSTEIDIYSIQESMNIRDMSIAIKIRFELDEQNVSTLSALCRQYLFDIERHCKLNKVGKCHFDTDHTLYLRHYCCLANPFCLSTKSDLFIKSPFATVRA